MELDGVGPGSGVTMASALLTDCSFSFKFPSFFLNWSVIKLESLTFEIICGVMKSINSDFLCRCFINAATVKTGLTHNPLKQGGIGGSPRQGHSMVPRLNG